MPGYHENWLPGRQLLNSGGQFIALHERELEVGHHQVELAPGKQSKRLGTVVGLNNGMFVPGKQPSDGFPYKSFVFDEQYALSKNVILSHCSQTGRTSLFTRRVVKASRIPRQKVHTIHLLVVARALWLPSRNCEFSLWLLS
jgi:hypothetical protein